MNDLPGPNTSMPVTISRAELDALRAAAASWEKYTRGNRESTRRYRERRAAKAAAAEQQQAPETDRGAL